MKVNSLLTGVFLSIALFSCKPDKMSPRPSISGFSPASGKPGDTITLTGSNFSTQPSDDIVALNSRAASVINATATTLTVEVPTGATTGRFSVTIKGQTGVSNDNFTVLPAIPPAKSPVIASFTPAFGLPGDTIVITGTNFSAVLTGNTVKFASNATALVTAATANQLTVIVPAAAATGTISAAVGALSGTSSASFEVLKDIPRNGLVAFYPFSGNADDASGHAFNLGLAGTFSSVADRFGLPGKSFYFNGGNSYAYSINPADAQVSQPLTVALWVKYDSLISSSVIGKYTVANGGFLLSIYGNGSVDAYTKPSLDYTTGSIMPKNTGGQWILLTVTYDGSVITVYKDAVLSGSAAYTGTVAAIDGDLRIGLSGNGGTGPDAFKCSIDDVTIYNRVLSSTEIQQLYTQTVSKK